MKRIYIAGPMTNMPALNFPAFRRAAADLRGQGHEVVSPAEINSDPKAAWLDCMRADIKQLVDCDAIALLPGWQASRGASLEAHIAEKLGMEFIFINAAESAQPRREA